MATFGGTAVSFQPSTSSSLPPRAKNRRRSGSTAFTGWISGRSDAVTSLSKLSGRVR